MIWFFCASFTECRFLGMDADYGGTICPATAIVGVEDPPLLMRIFPRDRYGQFCSSNAMWASSGGILCGVLAGVFFDTLKHHVDPGKVYYFIPVWQLTFTIPGFVS